MTEVPVSTSFDLENPHLAGWLDEQSLQLAGNVSDTTVANLQDTLRDGIRAGESVPGIRARVQDTFDTASRSRAELIARTEANKAANGASWVQAQSSGVVKTKTWLATKDGRTRPAHLAINGETVPIDEPFSNGKMFPDEVNCRCTLTYGVDESKITPEEERAEPVEEEDPFDDPFADEFGEDLVEDEPINPEILAQRQYEEAMLEGIEKEERSELFTVIMDAGGIQTREDLREEYREIANTFIRKDGLPGDEMAEYLAMYYPQYGIETERDLIDFFAEW